MGKTHGQGMLSLIQTYPFVFPLQILRRSTWALWRLEGLYLRCVFFLSLEIQLEMCRKHSGAKAKTLGLQCFESLKKSSFVENDESKFFIITRYFCWGMWSSDLCFRKHNEWSEFSTNQWKHWKHWDVLFSPLGSHMSRLIKRKPSWRHTTTSFILKVWSCWWKIKKFCLEKLLTLHSKMESQLTSWCWC